MRSLSKLGLECWIEPGGKIAGRYLGKEPRNHDMWKNWVPATEWQNKRWIVGWKTYDVRWYNFWASYMVKRIICVLKLHLNERLVTFRPPQKSYVLSEYVFVVHEDVYNVRPF